MKTPKGKQQQSQRDFQRIFEAAGYKYIIVRSFEEFKKEIIKWILFVQFDRRKYIASVHVVIEKERLEREREKLRKIVKKGQEYEENRHTIRYHGHKQADRREGSGQHTHT